MGVEYDLQVARIYSIGISAGFLIPQGKIYAARWVGQVDSYLELRDVADALGEPCWVPHIYFWVINNSEGPAVE